MLDGRRATGVMRMKADDGQHRADVLTNLMKFH